MSLIISLLDQYIYIYIYIWSGFNICCLILALLLESLEGPVSKKHINLLAKQLAENPSLNLTFLAAALNVEVDETVKRLKNVREQCFEILTRWHTQAAAEDATVGYLRRAVEEAL